MFVYCVDLEIEGLVEFKARENATAIKKAKAIANKSDDTILSIMKELVAPVDGITDGEFEEIKGIY